MKRLIPIAAVAALLGACQTTGDEPLRATAALQPTKGSKAFGEATFEQVGDKVRVVVFAQGLRPEVEHGFHIHEAGDCSSGDGMSAKGHFNPFGRPHGHPKAAERHAGDLPSLSAGKDGREGGRDGGPDQPEARADEHRRAGNHHSCRSGRLQDAADRKRGRAHRLRRDQGRLSRIS